jgi:hypothetical protein
VKPRYREQVEKAGRRELLLGRCRDGASVAYEQRTQHGTRLLVADMPVDLPGEVMTRCSYTRSQSTLPM